ncbi:SOS response-associated peptidase [Rasiella sp. SM2506]|uniref:SOS response-associated peptidase n=1 Tax=Rasiella sp. SM2506 TaxID=3423914 RepID=UPI003D7A854F
MCYETSSTKIKEAMEDYAQASFAVPLEYEPFYHRSAFGFPNLQIIPMHAPDEIYPSTWGFVPEWAMKDIDNFRKKYNTYNAKSETILSSGTFKTSAREKRCLILADGFFEPHKENNISIPYYCHIPTKEYKDGRDLFVFAGLYSQIAEFAYSCTIITTEANEFFSEVHNVKKRMPLVLDEGLKDEWLNDRLNDNNITELMQNGFTSKEFTAHPVSRDLYKRNIDTNNPSIIKPVQKDTLF